MGVSSLFSFSFSLDACSAWSPNLEELESWQSWARGESSLSFDGVPDVRFLPAMMRRRLSRLSKMALRAMHDCLGERESDNLEVVFASRHGEITRTLDLLYEVAKGNSLSPAAFSLSVHSSAPGLFSIARKCQGPSNTVSAGKNTLMYALLDAATRLRRSPESSVLVVIADEPLPGEFAGYGAEAEAPYALALLLSGRNEDGTSALPWCPSVEVTAYSSEEETSPEVKAKEEPLALAFWRWLLTGHGEELCISREGKVWRWRAHAGIS